MSALRFDIQWLDGTGIEGPELAATFAALRISVGDAVLTAVDDQRAQTLRDVVYVPVYPLAEWLVANWWFLAYEPEHSLNQGSPGFAHRHWLVASSEGYAYPDVRVSSAGGLTQLEWKHRASKWSRIEYRNSGSATLERNHFVENCADFIEKVTSRLWACDISSSYLQTEWDLIRTADDDERDFCVTAASLGRDPYDLNSR